MWQVVSRCIASGVIEESKLKSFDSLVSKGIRDVIMATSPIIHRLDNVWNIFHISNISMAKPVFTESNGTTDTIYPTDARTRGISYLSSVDASILHEAYTLNNSNPTETIPLSVVKSQGTPLIMPSRCTVRLMDFPVMLRSSLCHLSDGEDHRECSDDGGGYFIMGGNEKTIEFKERVAYNKIILSHDKGTAATHVAEMRCERAGLFRSTNNIRVGFTKSTQTEKSQLVVNNLPLVLTLKALGCSSGLQICEMFRAILGDKINEDFYTEVIRSTLEGHKNMRGKKECIEAIGVVCGIKAKADISNEGAGMHFLCERFIPQAGLTPESFPNKAWTLVEVACALLHFVRDPSLQTDLDSYKFKRTDSVQETIGFEYRKTWDSFVEKVKSNCTKAAEKNKSISISKVFGAEKVVTAGVGDFIKRGLQSIGSTQSKASAASASSISQAVSRNNFGSMKSQHGKIFNPLNKDGKQTGPRQLQPSGAGTVCSVDSPEGETCGLVKYKAIFNDFTRPVERKCVEDVMTKMLGVDPIINLEAPDYNPCFVVIDGFIFGSVPVEKAADLASSLRKWRRALCLSSHTGISLAEDHRRVSIRVDGSRNIRPMYVLENIHKLASQDFFSWNGYLSAGVIEYIDKEEEDDLVIAETPEIVSDWAKQHPGKPCPYTHMELHQAFIHGVSALQIPFMNHNQAPRNTYQCQMAKSAQGSSSSVSKTYRTDLKHNELTYPERQLVETRFSRLFGSHRRPAGQGLRVLLQATGGDAQEDAQMFNIASVQRGAGRSYSSRLATVAEKNKGREYERETIAQVDPSKCLRRTISDYTKVDEDGIVAVGSVVSDSTVLVQKTIKVAPTPTNSSSGDAVSVTHRDLSTIMPTTDSHAVVDKVVVTSNADNMKVVKVRYRSTCFPEKGDKFSSLHGQKGTIGCLQRPEDLPIDMLGFTVDVIINPLAFASRMTWGQVLEMIYSQICTHAGVQADGTPYSTLYRECLFSDGEKILENMPRDGKRDPVADVASALEVLGLRKCGQIRMRDGTTGKMMENTMFAGMTFIQKLSHMVNDKIRARGESGPVNSTTRQPAEGRKKRGGLKIGEMESDAFQGYGAADTLLGLHVHASDKTTFHVCSKCNNPAVCDPNGEAFCTSCGSESGEINQFVGSGSMGVFREYMQAMGLNVTMHV